MRVCVCGSSDNISETDTSTLITEITENVQKSRLPFQRLPINGFGLKTIRQTEIVERSIIKLSNKRTNETLWHRIQAEIQLNSQNDDSPMRMPMRHGN